MDGICAPCDDGEGAVEMEQEENDFANATMDAEPEAENTEPEAADLTAQPASNPKHHREEVAKLEAVIKKQELAYSLLLKNFSKDNPLPASYFVQLQMNKKKLEEMTTTLQTEQMEDPEDMDAKAKRGQLKETLDALRECAKLSGVRQLELEQELEAQITALLPR